HSFARLGQGFFRANNVQPAFGCHFQPPFGHDADDIRLQFQRDADDFRHVGHFEIEPGLDGFAQLPNVAVLDVPAVFAQMRGDAVRAGGFTNPRRLDRIRFAETAPTIPRLAERCDVVNVDAEFEHGQFGNADN